MIGCDEVTSTCRRLYVQLKSARYHRNFPEADCGPAITSGYAVIKASFRELFGSWHSVILPNAVLTGLYSARIQSYGPECDWAP